MRRDGSLVTRIGAVAGGLTLALVAVLGIGFYMEQRRDITRDLTFAVNSDAAVTVKETVTNLKSLATTLHGLASNTLVANALADTLGREAYLEPFLKGFEGMTGLTGVVALTDFAGKPIASSGTLVLGEDAAGWIRQVVDSGEARARFSRLNGVWRIELADPVVYANTGTVEGVLLIAIPAPEIARAVEASRIDGVMHGLAVAGSEDAWIFGSGEPVRLTAAFTHRAIDLPPPLSSIGLEVVSKADPQLIDRPLRELSWVFAIAALIVVVGVTLAAAALSLRLVMPLRRLEKAASSFDFTAPDMTFAAAGFGNDEIGRLAAAFASMVDRLSTAYGDLAAANKELESFSYSVSHDLRTPLRAIDGFSQILIDEYRGKLDDEGQRLLNVVRDNAVRMGLLIDDILRYSRTGRQELQAVPVDLGKLAQEVFEDLRQTAGDRRIRLDVNPMPPALGDRGMLRQVLVNLLANAVKFTRPRSEAVIELGGQADADHNTYYVRDNGVGFDMRYVDKIFGVFERLHANDAFDGTGIGLAIVKRIILRHGGTVWAEGKVDAGATIGFSLPSGGSGHVNQ